MIGKGVNLVICEHSHTVQFFPSKPEQNKKVSHCSSHHCPPPAEEDCQDPDKDCMNKIFYSLSQSEISQQINIELSPAVIQNCFISLQYIWFEKSHREKIYTQIILKPPRDYLSCLTILLI